MTILVCSLSQVAFFFELVPTATTYSSGQLTACALSEVEEWTWDSCFVKEIKWFLLWAIGSIHEVIYVLTAVAIAVQPFTKKNGFKACSF
ncbi:hypothetical protein [Microcoleus sp. bin38.metabat.b11b12b14.051]|uniref:hypothetical protein n=1 Tax=Microcoleus sp. bin38.metabat.b11b12b14.051 TaxID=2742709 RepID=UPI0025E7A6C2|nr:hypothetical protein [Microcoleus sp. bin38.metabat.b11b12b14.051]